LKTVLISGAKGFIASHAARFLKDAGFRTVGISRTVSELEAFDVVYSGQLTEPLGKVLDAKIETFVHCAYFSGKNDFAVNVEGTKLWAEQAEEKGIEHQIFLSSLSARKNSASSYSRAKFDLEEWFVERGHTVLRLGLVLGRGGLFHRMAQLVKAHPILPLPDGGRAQVFFLGIEEVNKALLETIEAGEKLQKRVWNLFQSQPETLHDMFKGIKTQYGAFCLFVPVPSFLILGLVRILEKLPLLKMEVSSNNIIGLRQKPLVPVTSDFSRFALTEKPLADLVKKALE
jgi:nucleoside-diphosphate-sugar epimerase